MTKSGLVLELKKDGTPEGVKGREHRGIAQRYSRFRRRTKGIGGCDRQLIRILEDVALATDFDNEK